MLTRREGTTICDGKYRIDRVLGEGGMGVVYAVTQLHVNRRYALKTLHSHLVPRRKVRERFLREGWIANAVKHPGVVEVFEDGVDHDTPFLVMELLEGVAVDALGADATLPLQDALCITHQLLDVLEAAHRAGIVHRDIKPANLFMREDGRLKVLDFGISKLHETPAGWDTKATTSIVGTPAFMAPEQARGESSDGRADLFGVGATLFTLLSGEHLHLGDDPAELVGRASAVPARSLVAVAPQTPERVLQLVARAVAFDKSERWESASAMRDEVLAAHEMLFGPLQPERLRESVKQFKLSLQRSPTEFDLADRHERKPPSEAARSGGTAHRGQSGRPRRAPFETARKRAPTTNSSETERPGVWQTPAFPTGDGTLSFVLPVWAPSAALRWGFAALAVVALLTSVAFGVARRSSVPTEKHASPDALPARPIASTLTTALMPSGAEFNFTPPVPAPAPAPAPAPRATSRRPIKTTPLPAGSVSPSTAAPSEGSLPVARAYHSAPAH